MKILRCFALLLPLFFLNVSNADLWTSEVEEKYRMSSPHLYKKYEHAKELYNNIATGHEDNLKKSLDILQQVIQEDENFSPAYYQLTRILASNGYMRNQQGIDTLNTLLDKAIEIEPDYPDPYIYHANIERRTNNVEKAKEYLEKAKSLNTKSPWYDINMGRIAMDTNKTDQAINHFEAVFNRSDITNLTKSIVITELIKFYRNKKEYKSVIKYYEAMIDVAPYEQNNWQNYGDVLLYDLGRLDDAITKFEKAFELNPSEYDESLYESFAVAFYSKWAELKDTDTELANKYYQKGKSINSNFQHIYNQAALYGYPALEKTTTALSQRHGIKGVPYTQPPGYTGVTQNNKP